MRSVFVQMEDGTVGSALTVLDNLEDSIVIVCDALLLEMEATRE